tara:strand:- start:567 stop:938 length:372 start_codon:yes stop_codon:yes gene_type:complete
MDGDRLIGIALWVLSFVLAIVFFYNGIGKLAGSSFQVEKFEALGLPHYLLTVVGALECIGALMLTVPRLAMGGSLILSLIMASHAGLNIIHDNNLPVYRALVIISMLAGISYLRYRWSPNRTK